MTDAMRLVLDTNTIVSAACFPNSFGRRAFNWANANCVILASETSIAELAEVIVRPRFERFLTAPLRIAFLHEFEFIAELVTITVRIKLCRDPSDDHVLELAVSGAAQYIVSRVLDLLVLNPFRGIGICDAKAFLGMVTAPQ